MICETVTITDREIVVSYSGDGLSLTPEIEARLRVYWAARIERITRLALGLPEREGPGTFSGNDPEREQVPPNRPLWGSLIPDGNIT